MIPINQMASEVESLRAETDQQLEEVQVQRAREHLRPFCQYVIKDMSTTAKITLWEGHLEWIEHINRCWRPGARIGIMGPMGHGKSAIAAIALPLYLLGIDQRLRIGIVCNSDTHASNRVITCGEYIRNDPDYHRVFPAVQPDVASRWNASKLIVKRPNVANEGSLESHGIDARGTASRYDVLIFDDPIDIEDMNSAATRENRIAKYRYVWIKRLEPHGVAVMICNRWAEGDLASVNMETDQWRWLVQGVNEDITGIDQPPSVYSQYQNVTDNENPKTLPLWNARWPASALQDDLEETGPNVFSLTRRMIPTDPSSCTFDWDKMWESVLWDKEPRDLVEDSWPRYTGVDLSGDKRKGCVIYTYARAPHGQNYMTDIQRGDWGFDQKMARRVHEVYVEQGSQIVAIENNFAQQTMVALITAMFGKSIPVKGICTGKQKLDPQDGLPGLAIQVENNGWIFPYGKVKSHEKKWSRCRCGYCTFLREVRFYPRGESIDTLMAWWQATRVGGRTTNRGRPHRKKNIGEARVFSAPRRRVFAGPAKRAFTGMSSGVT